MRLHLGVGVPVNTALESQGSPTPRGAYIVERISPHSLIPNVHMHQSAANSLNPHREVDLIGVMYTAHLAIFYLPKNPNSTPASPFSNPDSHAPDRHLLLLGSVASLGPIPGQVLYCTAKHGVLGLFRALRSTAFMNGIRVNMLCPYFIDTPIIPTGGRVLLAGGAIGKIEDVVDAGTRLMADSRIVGRALVVGPKVRVDDDWQLVPQIKEGREVAVWEAYADDFEEVEAFSARFVRLLNQVEKARGWVGWASDMASALTYPLRGYFGRV